MVDCFDTIRIHHLIYSVTPYTKFHHSSFEYGFFNCLHTYLPSDVKAILLLDRGFHRVELQEFLNEKGFFYVIRSGGTAWTSSSRYEGYLGNCIRERGKMVDLQEAKIRRHNPLSTRVVGVWAKNQKEAWILVTNLDENAHIPHHQSQVF